MMIDKIIGLSLNEADACQPSHCEERSTEHPAHMSLRGAERRGNLVFQPRIAASDGFALPLAMTGGGFRWALLNRQSYHPRTSVERLDGNYFTTAAITRRVHSSLQESPVRWDNGDFRNHGSNRRGGSIPRIRASLRTSIRSFTRTSAISCSSRVTISFIELTSNILYRRLVAINSGWRANA
jgi:hypothetical protein